MSELAENTLWKGSAMTDFTGMQLGNYRVVRLLGQGGFADVYLGEHVYLKTFAAIKVVQTRMTGEDMDTFLREAQMVSSLVHPNIVRVLEFGREGTTPFLVMDYAPHGTLRQRHPRGSRLAPTAIVPYVRQVAAALQYAHDRRLIHRDVKPENMLIGANNEVLLSDFGIALLAQSSRYQSTQDVVGTAAYMAPEQFEGRPVPASDQYALGVVVYEWLTGERPFHGSFAEIASQHMLAVPALREKAPGVSPVTEEVVRTALAKDPQNRFLRVEAFANAFEQSVRAAPGPQPSFAGSQIAPPSSITPPPQVGRLPQSGSSFSTSSPFQSAQQPAQLSQSGQITSTTSNQGDSTPGWPPMPASGQARPPMQGQSGAQYPQPPSAPLIVPPPSQTLPPQVARSYSDQTGATYVMQPPRNQGQGWGQGQSASSGVQFPPAQGPSSGGNFPPAQGPAFPQQSPQPQQPAQQTPQQAKRGMSRRTVLIGGTFGALGLIVVGGGIAWLESGHQKTPSASGGTTATAAVNKKTPTSAPTQDPTAGPTETTTPGETPTSSPATGAVVTFTGHSRYIAALAWSPDGSKIATASGDGTVQVWDAASGTSIYTYTGHQNQNQNASVNAVAWSLDSTTVYSAATDIQVWKAVDGTKLFTYTGHSNNTIHCLALSPDGKSIASGSDDNTVQVWDANSGSHLATHTANGTVRSLTWSPDGARIASTVYDTVEVWNSTSGNLLNTYKGHSGNNVNAVAWSHNGKHVASGSDDRTVQVWDAASLSASYTYTGHAQPVYAVSWSADDSRVASGGADITVQVWNASGGSNRFVYHGHNSQVNTVEWSPNGKEVASGSGDPNTYDGSDDHTAQVWQPPS